jgi:hypothetical protein
LDVLAGGEKGTSVKIQFAVEDKEQQNPPRDKNELSILSMMDFRKRRQPMESIRCPCSMGIPSEKR